jgi:transposase
MISDPRTRAYAAKRTAAGNSRKEIMRILMRYIARELHPLIIEAFLPSPPRQTRTDAAGQA